MRVGRRWFINWCSNDYLGLSQHPALIAAAARATRAWGVGARASRLLAGSTAVHRELEEALAAWFGAEEALVFPSGYQTNLAVLGTLLQPADIVWADRRIHASLAEGIRASRATLKIFRHTALDRLARWLARRPASGRQVIVTEGVFSMDGERADLNALLALAEKHGALLYVDDAHGAFVEGRRGRGSPEAAGVAHKHLLYMATLGKALGAQGGFVIGPHALIDWLRNRARPFIYTTAPAVPVMAAAREALRVLAREPQHRRRLQQRIRQLRAAFTQAGLPIAATSSHIVPFIVGGSAQALALAEALKARGLWAPAIRPPTVPAGTARLRLSLTAAHTPAQLQALTQALAQARPWR